MCGLRPQEDLVVNGCLVDNSGKPLKTDILMLSQFNMGNWHVPCKTTSGTSGCQHLPQGLQLIDGSARGRELNALRR